MAEPPPPLPGDDPPEVADASWLTGEAETIRLPAGDEHPDETAPADGAYDLAPHDEDVIRPTVAPVPPPEPSQRAPRPAAEPRPRPTIEPSQAVEQVWTRTAEWGHTLAVLAAAALAVGFVVYIFVSLEWFGFAVVSLLGGGLVLAFLSYPILITLERPVRVTPEQAVKDFYGALSHHVPHYRRMWLLLSTAGKTSGSFASLEGFTQYWKDRLDQLRGDRAGRLTPLKFQVVDFKSDKSAGLTTVDARFRIEVYIRGRLDEGPIASIPIGTSLVRGPDKMWYLDRGTLPPGSE